MTKELIVDGGALSKHNRTKCSRQSVSRHSTTCAVEGVGLGVGHEICCGEVGLGTQALGREVQRIRVDGEE